MKISQRSDYTFKYNAKLGRHGWLRLTPAYSVKIVQEIINNIDKNIDQNSLILDPFSGTATTGLVAAEHGLYTHCFDINPFLIWLGNAKCRRYSEAEITYLSLGVETALVESRDMIDKNHWLPNIYNITRWWSGNTLRVLAALRQALVNQFSEPMINNVSALAWIAFCRLVIETSSAAFNHVSMSFRDEVVNYEVEQIQSLYKQIISVIIESARENISGSASVYLCDSIKPGLIKDVKYSYIITSPPYPNRMSYIRELRPYMYWTKFLDTPTDAGELDWKSIGGTWGVATSRLKDWKSNEVDLPKSLNLVVLRIAETKEKNAMLMANYVHKYFHDMHLHFKNIQHTLDKGAHLFYIVGNSSFYGVQVHTEKLLQESLASLGFTNVGSKVVRKRNSKKELFEYCIYATWKQARKYVPLFFSNT